MRVLVVVAVWFLLMAGLMLFDLKAAALAVFFVGLGALLWFRPPWAMWYRGPDFKRPRATKRDGRPGRRRRR